MLHVGYKTFLIFNSSEEKERCRKFIVVVVRDEWNDKLTKDWNLI